MASDSKATYLPSELSWHRELEPFPSPPPEETEQRTMSPGAARRAPPGTNNWEIKSMNKNE